jgi:hypothetical protein
MSNSMKAQLWGFGSLAAVVFIAMYANNFSAQSIQLCVGCFIGIGGLIKTLQYATR